MKSRKLITFDRLLPEKGIGYSRATIARKMKEEPPKFPQCVRTSNKHIAWYEDEIDEHVASLERGSADAPYQK